MQHKSFHFSVGDSNTGPIGMCLTVRAESREEAVKLANEQLAGISKYEFPSNVLTDGLEYCEIYFNPTGGLTIADIDEEYETEVSSREEELSRRLKFSTPKISARFHSDDYHVDLNFDANRWFSDASDEEIIDLSLVHWGGSVQSDRIAYFMESRDLEIERALDYARIADIGFEVEVDEDDAKQWVALHRPNLLNRLK